MTISTQTAKVTVLGNGVQTTFNYNFEIPAKSQAILYFTAATGLTTIVPAAAWSMTGAGVSSGGTFTYPLSGTGIATGAKLTLLRDVPEQQNTNLINQGGYYPEAVEGGLDTQMFTIQQLRENVDRAIVGPVTEASIGPPLPPAAQRAGQLLGFSGTGAPTLYPPLFNGGTIPSDFIVSTGSTTPRSLQDRFAEWKNVKDYGAAGDGVTDDTVAIQAAMNAITSTYGGVLFFPPGRYVTSSPIVVGAQCVTIMGSTLGQNNSIGSQIRAGINHDIITCTGFGFFQMFNMALDRPATGNTTPCNHLVLTNAGNAKIENCLFRNIWNGALFDGCSGVTLTNCEFRDPKATFGVSYGVCLSDAAGPSLVTHIVGCHFYGINNVVGSVGILSFSSDTAYVTFCDITKWGTGIKLTSGVGPTSAFWHISTCELENNTSSVWLDCVTRCYIVDVQVALSGDHGYRIGPGAPGQASFVGCMAVNCDRHGYFFDGVTGGSYALTGCIASGNSQEAGVSYDGVNIANTDNVTINGGRFGGAGANSLPSSVTQRNGVRVTGAAVVGISVIGANLEGNSYPFISGATDNPTIVGCRGFIDPIRQARQGAAVNGFSAFATNTGTSPTFSAFGDDTDLDIVLIAKGAGVVRASNPVGLPPYPVASVPAASVRAGTMIYVTNETGGAVPAFSDGTNWRRVTDRAIIS